MYKIVPTKEIIQKFEILYNKNTCMYKELKNDTIEEYYGNIDEGGCLKCPNDGIGDDNYYAPPKQNCPLVGLANYRWQNRPS